MQICNPFAVCCGQEYRLQYCNGIRMAWWSMAVMLLEQMAWSPMSSPFTNCRQLTYTTSLFVKRETSTTRAPLRCTSHWTSTVSTIEKQTLTQTETFQLFFLSFSFCLFTELNWLLFTFIVVLPVNVRIVSNKTELIAGRKIDLRCEAYGSKPAAIIKWFKNNQPLSHST